MIQMEKLSKAIADLDEPNALKLVQQFLASGPSGADLNQAIKACQEGMIQVGNRYETKEYFLAELIFGAEIMKEVMALMLPRLKVSPTRIGKVVLGTAQGDIHDIGKNIVRDMLDVAGFEVYDLGIDVPIQQFVAKVRETNAQIVGISCLLTLATETMKGTVDAIKKAGLRDRVKIIIGGNPVDEMVRVYVGADRFTRSAPEGVEICKKWVGGLK
jgi:dimethylamine corrinoid protein